MKINSERLKQMYKYKNYDKEIIKLVLTIVLAFVIDLAFPILTKQLLDVQIPDKNVKGVILFGVIYILIGIISWYFTLKFCIIRLNLRYNIRGALKEDIFNKLQTVSTKFYDKNTTGMILQFLSNDADDSSLLFPKIIVEMYVMGIGRMIAISIILLFVNIEIALGIIGIYTLGIILHILLNRKTINLLKQIRKTNIEVFNLMNEGIRRIFYNKRMFIARGKS